ncbi:MAG: hypothetical protein AAFX01_13015 [Cyanobacteria bacterium J06638_28]
MLHFSPSLKLFQWSAIPFIAFGLITALPAASSAFLTPGSSEDRNYGECAEDLLAEGIAADAAAAACALAFRPTEMSGCVTGVLATAEVAPLEALSACSRDRRPDEVATCVGNIHDELAVTSSKSVLDHCHRSILPERYATCVVDLANVIDYDTEEALSRCTAAGYRPENIAPTYIPLN